MILGVSIKNKKGRSMKICKAPWIEGIVAGLVRSE